VEKESEVVVEGLNIIPQKGGPAFDLLGSALQTKVSGNDTGRVFCVVSMEAPPQCVVPMHHHSFPEVFYVLSGEAEFGTIANGNEKWQTAEEGETVIVRSNAPHSFRNPGVAPTRMLVVAAPEHEEFIQAAGRPVDQHPGSDGSTNDELDRIARIAALHRIFLD
jgi:quercetin dioxygenase-like cupin family protein